jgi:hypothetical protein
MSEQEKEQIKWINAFGNKVIGVIAGGGCIGLFMTFMFMTSIQSTIENTNTNVNLKFMGVDKQFDKIDVRFNKVEDKVDGIYYYNVPDDKQVQEPRKKQPNF